jgi:hypothetical protein
MDSNTQAVTEQLKGIISVNIANNQTLDEFCVEHIPEYNRDRFEALAIRLFLGEETIITIYAIDKQRQEGVTFKKDKLPVKKFKLSDVPLSTLFSYCGAFNCTLTTGNYQMEDMEVINR